MGTRPIEPHPDEVIFGFHGLDAGFTDIVRKYAGARALANESPAHRDVYAGKADEHLRGLRRWLQENFTSRVRLTYQGVDYTMSEALSRTSSSASQDPEELLRIISSAFLAPHFAERLSALPVVQSHGAPPQRKRSPDQRRGRRAFYCPRHTHHAGRCCAGGLELLMTREHQALTSPYARYFLDKLQDQGT